jgi:asparagine synthase (glutamine-hydrolysing)
MARSNSYAIQSVEKLYVMSPTEIALGYVFGQTGDPLPGSSQKVTAREALERVVGEALRRPPCGVAFSGGRDSSLILAVATHVARREGLPDPVPITKVFPNAPGSDETDWQELVIRHLRLHQWERIVFADELDLVGPLAARHLLRHGVLWPPTIHADAPVLERVSHGSLLDGEGGDEVLGVEAHRIAPLTHLLRSPRPVRRSRLRVALRALTPARIRGAPMTRQWIETAMPWIRPTLQDQLIESLRIGEAAEPLSFAASVRRVPQRRTFVLLAHNRRLLAVDSDVHLSSPLLHTEVVQALAREGGVMGRGDRTAVLRALVPDLLPDVVLARPDKAEFGDAFWAQHAHEFARQWTGVGVDDDLVDSNALKRLWCSEEHHALTSALLQQAWLADHRSSQRHVQPD